MADTAVLAKILERLDALSDGQKELERKFESLSVPQPLSPHQNGRYSPISPEFVPAMPVRVRSASSLNGGIDALNEARRASTPQTPVSPRALATSPPNLHSLESLGLGANMSLEAAGAGAGAPGLLHPRRKGESTKKKSGTEEIYPHRVILTTYPSQAGIHPLPLNWGAGPSPLLRGPVLCSRYPASLPLRNAIGAHSGSYSIYRALSIAMKNLPVDWRPDLTDTNPPFVLGPKPGWFCNGKDDKWDESKKGWSIVSLDPWGAMSQEVWAKEYAQGIDIRPTISQTKAHIKIQELDEMVKQGQLEVDGRIVQRSPELKAYPGVDQGIEVNSYKAAIDPVWHLPGVAERLGVDESLLRRALFEDTGGMYAELLTRPDLKVFLPPIGGMTVYIFGDPAKLSDPNTEVTCRPHDECNGSDVFGSDICTCRPYLIYGIAEAVKCAQRGGVGIVVYFRKEGRALGEVTKYLVYNLRKRGGDSAAKYFKSTEMVAGVKDARMQALMPDVFHWLGVKTITNLISMSNLKYDALIKSGITVINRYELSSDLMPADSQVEIDAKIQSGYFSKKVITEGDLEKTVGRSWEDVEH